MPIPTQPSTPAPQPSGGPQGTPGSDPSGQPPIGSSPATQPVANRGLQAAGLAKLQVVVKQLESLLPVFGAGSEAGKAVLESLNKLAKHVQPGSVSPGVEQNALQELMMKLRQGAPQVAAMKAASMGGAGGAPQAPGAGGQPQIPPQLAAMMARPQGSA